MKTLAIKNDDSKKVKRMKTQWLKERRAYMGLCKVYFDIASELIGEDNVRKLRDMRA